MRPARLRATGKGWVESEASGRIFHASEMVDDVRQGRVHRTEADFTPGFGTAHPQDERRLGHLDDPKAVPNARPQKNDYPFISYQDLCVSDEEREESIRNGTPLVKR